MTWGDLHPPTPNLLPIYPHPNLFPPLLESFKMLVEALASSEYCSFFFLWFFFSLSPTCHQQRESNNSHHFLPMLIFLMSVCVRVRVCCSTKGCMTVKGWSRCFLKVVSSPLSPSPSLSALPSLLRCFLTPSRSPSLWFVFPHVSLFLYLSIY